MRTHANIRSGLLIALGALALSATDLVTPATALTQPPPHRSGMDIDHPHPGRRSGPRFARDLIRPSAIMRHRTTIGLTEEQRAAIDEALLASQDALMKSRWDVEEASEDLRRLLAADRVDEAEALRQVDRVLRLETVAKRAHLAMLIRVKNVLTPEQQQALQKLDRSGRRGKRGGPPGPPPH